MFVLRRHWKWVMVTWILWVMDCHVGSVTFPKDLCYRALGMESGSIPDSDVSASSSYDVHSSGPSLARVRTDRLGGAWCPKTQIHRDSYEYLEVDLGNLTVITKVETQGRFANGVGREYTSKYRLEYQRIENSHWHRYADVHLNEIIQGNNNTYMAVLRKLTAPIICRKIRVIPVSERHVTACMRVEFYGCPWQLGLVSYKAPMGDTYAGEIELIDDTYDGSMYREYMEGGLGQLTDGRTMFSQDIDHPNIAFDWVGWQRDQHDGRVVFEFFFDSPRNFTNLRLLSSNRFYTRISVFEWAQVHFSLDGRSYEEEPVVYHHVRDSMIDSSRWVLVRIPNRIGKSVKVTLTFDNDWMMISEVDFESTPAQFPLQVSTTTTEASTITTTKPATTTSTTTPTTSLTTQVITFMTSSSEINSNKSLVVTNKDRSLPAILTKTRLFSESVAAILLALTLLFFVTSVVFIVLYAREKRGSKRENYKIQMDELPQGIQVESLLYMSAQEGMES